MLRVVTRPASPPAALDPEAMVSVLEATAADQTRVERLIQDATRVAETIARRQLWRRTYEAIVEGDGDTELYLPIRPVESVTSVAFAGDSTAIVEEGTDAHQFELWGDAGMLLRRSGWRRGAPGWRVIFVGGYWLPSDGDTPTAGAYDLSVEGAHLRRAVEEIVQASWSLEGVDRTVRAERIGGKAGLAIEYETGVFVPKGAEQVLASLRPIVS